MPAHPALAAARIARRRVTGQRGPRGPRFLDRCRRDSRRSSRRMRSMIRARGPRPRLPPALACAWSFRLAGRHCAMIGTTMASYQVISWRGVPTVVEARDAEGTVARSLSDRFQALIDSMAMQLGLADSDDYLAAWARSGPAERPGTADEVAAAVAADLEMRFPEFVARTIRP